MTRIINSILSYAKWLNLIYTPKNQLLKSFYSYNIKDRGLICPVIL